MRVQPKLLVQRLSPIATTLLERAVAQAADGRHYEIVPEHLLVAIVSQPDADAAEILAHFEQDRGRLLGRLEASLRARKLGNAGRPVFAEALFQWIEDAWTLASLLFGVTRLRTGHLLLQFIERSSRYTAEEYPELDAIDSERLRREFAAIVQRSNELDMVPQVHQAEQVGGATASAGLGPHPSHIRPDSALGQFTVSLTQQARDGRIDPIFARQREIRQLIDILARRRKNNPIIVGEPGVGKTALVEGLALAIVEGQVPDLLEHTELLALDMGLLHAGASVKGELEKRLKAVISEIGASPSPIVLFIDEAHTLIDSAANLLKPALARGELRTVAATTWSEFKRYFEKDPALERRFQPVKCDEPSVADTIVMLRGLVGTYEASHRVTIRDAAVVAAAELSSRYISGRQLPDKAVDLLDTAAARVKVEQAAKPPAIERLEQALASSRRHLAALERDLGEGATIDGDPAALAGEIAELERELVEARARWADRAPARDSPAVEAEVVAEVVADWTGIPVGKLKTDSISAALELDEVLGRRVKGQEPAVEVVAQTVRMAYAGVRDPNAPIGVLLFVGTSGVGKTEMALALADQLYGGERFMTTINMSEFQEKHTVSRLIGSPPGYVGFGEGGRLTEAVRQRPYSVVLLDECEKADPDVMNLFYQVFDKGTLADGEGRVVDFKHTLVILTSNLGSDRIMGLYARAQPPSHAEVIEAIRPIVSAHFKPALLARMTMVPFRPIGPDVMREIASSKLAKLGRRLLETHGITASFAPGLLDELVRRCGDADTGARNVDHTLRGSLMPALAKLLLERMAEGQLPTALEIGLGSAGGWRFTPSGG